MIKDVEINRSFGFRVTVGLYFSVEGKSSLSEVFLSRTSALSVGKIVLT